MKKKIVFKIMLIFVIILLVNTAGTTMSMMNARRVESNVIALEDIYLEIRSTQTEIASGIETIKMYCNMIATTKSETYAARMAGSMPGDMELLNAAVEKLETLCKEIENPDVLVAFNAYNESVRGLLDISENVLACYQAGNAEGAEAAQGGMYKATLAMDAAYTSLQDILLAEQDKNILAIDNAIEYLKNILCFIAVLLFIGVVVGGAYIYIVIARPINKGNAILKDVVEKINQNEGDLTVRIPVKQEDEIGQLLTGINHFLDTLQKVMISIRSGATRMNDSAEEINEKVLHCKDETDSVSATMQELSASMEEISATMQSIDEGSEQVLASAQGIGSEVAATVKLVEGLGERADEISSNSVTKQEETKKIVSDIQKRMTVAIEESKSVERINELTADILNISSQTNLLALNASIEAARAGEAGRGFSVVADQIRILAEESKQTANDIQEISGAVMNSVQDLVQNAGEILEYISESILKDYDAFVGSAENYKDDASRLKEVFEVFKEKSAEMEEIAQRITLGISEINTAVTESTESVVIATESTSNMLGSMENIANEAGENKGIANVLNDEVSRFKKLETEE